MTGARRNLKLGRVALLATALGILLWFLLAEPIPVVVVRTDLRDMVKVAGGSFTASGRLYELSAYRIDRFEVSERDWQRFVTEAGAKPLPIPPGLPRSPDYPARYVTAPEAEAFAAFHLKRLPSNLEWERASQGPAGSAFPWGEAYLPAANTQEAWRPRFYQGWGVTRVGIFERGRSEAGCYDMIGNVWEWTASNWQDALRRPLLGDLLPAQSSLSRASSQWWGKLSSPLSLSWKLADWRIVWEAMKTQRVDRVAPELAYRNMRFIRGGSFTRPIRGADPEVERLEHQDVVSWDIGFRCVISESEVELQAELAQAAQDLGWSDPVNWLFRVKPALRKIRALGPRAWPYLARTRATMDHDLVRARLDELIEELKSETK